MITGYGDHLQQVACDYVRESLFDMGLEFSSNAIVKLTGCAFSRPTYLYAFTDSGAASCAIQISHRAWDSSIYQLPIFTFTFLGSQCSDSLPQVLREAVQHIVHEEAKLVIARAPASNVRLLQIMEDAGFRIMDVQTPLFCKVNSSADSLPSDGNMEVRRTEPSDLESIVEISRSAFYHSHLYGNPQLPREATDTLHEQWVTNDCQGGRARISLTAAQKGRVAGFVTVLWNQEEEHALGLKHAHIDLLAVKPEYQGRGIGRRLVCATMSELRRLGTEVVTVSTQSDNREALRLYLRSEFDLLPPQVTCHLWIPAYCRSQTSSGTVSTSEG